MSDEEIREAAKSKSSFLKLANELLDAREHCLTASRKEYNIAAQFWSDKTPGEYCLKQGEYYWDLSERHTQDADTLQSILRKLKHIQNSSFPPLFNAHKNGWIIL